MKLKKRFREQNKMEPKGIDAISFTELITGYRTLVNKCRLNQQDAFWAILVSESQEATSFLGADEHLNKLTTNGINRITYKAGR